MKKALFSSAIGLMACSLANAAMINIDGYTYNTAPNSTTFYGDTGGVELTDGDALTDVWPQAIGPADFAPLVSWFNIDPDFTLNFNSAVTIDSFRIWIADSDGTAGVALPTSITLSTSGGFTQTFAITNPAGSGTTVPIDLDGFSVNTDNLQVQITATPSSHTMISEVSVASVPEPSSTALLGLGGLALLLRRKK